MNERRPPVSIGIDSIALSFPRSYIDLADLAAARGVPAAKYQQGLGMSRMAIPAWDEDPVTLGINGARRLFQRSDVRPEEIGLCITGTETAVDHSKPVAAFIHGRLGLPSACRSFETKHACFGGTAGVLNALDWIASGSARGRAALVICTDVARYAVGSAGEPTQGAGAVAMIVRERPRLVELEVGVSGSYTRDVYDFWRPLDHKDALVDGRFSVQCYLDALGSAYGAWCALPGALGEPLARTCYHVPYGKMARKAHRHRRMLDGLTEAEADETFAVEVEPSLRLPAEVGNMYTGSLYLAIASLLHAEAAAITGERVGFFSYGSGSTAEFFAGRVAPGAAAMVKQLELDAPLHGRHRLTIAEYEELRRGEVAAERRPAPMDVSAGSDGLERTAVFLGFDQGERRVYGNV